MRFNRNTYSGRSILKGLGTKEVQATFALQQIQLDPRSSDPDAGATVIIVKAVQRGMNQLGCPLAVTGRIDDATRACLSRVSGKSWESRPWLKITKDILEMRDNGLRLPPSSPNPYQGVGAVSFGSKAGGLLLLGGIAYLALKYK